MRWYEILPRERMMRQRAVAHQAVTMLAYQSLPLHGIPRHSKRTLTVTLSETQFLYPQGLSHPPSLAIFHHVFKTVPLCSFLFKMRRPAHANSASRRRGPERSFINDTSLQNSHVPATASRLSHLQRTPRPARWHTLKE